MKKIIHHLDQVVVVVYHVIVEAIGLGCVLRTAGSSIKSVVVVYHVTIVAIGHGLLKKFWPLVLGCVYALQGVQVNIY